MGLTQQEFQQLLWTNPRRSYHRAPGDFYSATGLIPSPDRQKIQRGPAWGSFQTLPAGIDDIVAITYLAADDKFLLIGNDGTNLVAVSTSDLSSFGTVQTLVSSKTSYGGRRGQNVLHWGGDIWLITSDGDIYRGVWDSSPSSFFTSTNVEMLAAMNDRVYAVDETGRVLRLNDAANAMETFWTPTDNLTPLAAYAFGANFYLFVQRDATQLEILKLPDYQPSTTRASLALTIDCPPFNAEDALFTRYQGNIYFATGRRPDDTIALYRFSGYQVEFVCKIPVSSESTATAGLLVWNGELMFYELLLGNTTESQQIKLITTEGYVDLEALTGSVRTGLQPTAACTGGKLLVTGENDNDQGFYTADLSSHADGTLTTSRYDFGTLRLKRLNQLSVVLDDANTDLKVKLYYRTNDTTAWTLATTGNNTRIVSTDLTNQTFYTLQVKIEIDDDSGNDVDVGIESLSVRFTA